MLEAKLEAAFPAQVLIRVNNLHERMLRQVILNLTGTIVDNNDPNVVPRLRMREDGIDTRRDILRVIKCRYDDVQVVAHVLVSPFFCSIRSLLNRSSQP